MSTSERSAGDAAYDIELFAAQALARAMRVADQMSGCANRHNLAIVETFRRAAAIARDPRRNPHCSNCGDTRGGPFGHEISECTWVAPAGIFEERDQCRGDELPGVVAAARREGWAQAIEALRDREAWLEWWRTHPLSSFDEYLNSRAADYLTDRAAALVMPPVAAPVEPAC